MVLKTSPASGLLHPSRRRFLQTTGLLSAALATPATIGRALTSEPLYVNTWGGKWEENAQKFFFQPFTAKTGITKRFYMWVAS